MTRRQIILHNDSGRDGDFGVFVAFPHVFCEDIGRMHTSAWVSKFVRAGDYEEIDLDTEVYAWHSTAPTDGQRPTHLENGTVFPATLGTSSNGSSFATSTLTQPSGPYSRTLLKTNALNPLINTTSTQRSTYTSRATSATSATPPPSVPHFTVQTQSRPVAPELLGLAKRHPETGAPVPVVAFEASPGFTYHVSPQEQYIISRITDTTPNKVVDLRSVASRRGVVDFALSRPTTTPGAGDVAVVRVTASGAYTVEYKPKPTPRALGKTLSSISLTRGNARKAGASAKTKAGGDLDHWTGTLLFPSTTATTAVVKACGVVIDALAPKYAWTVKTAQTEEGGVGMKVRFWLREGDGRQPYYFYEEDWGNAVAGIDGGDDEEVVEEEEEDADEDEGLGFGMAGGSKGKKLAKGKKERNEDSDGAMDLGCMPATPWGSSVNVKGLVGKQ